MKKLRLYGCPDSREMYTIRDYLQRSVVGYELANPYDRSDDLPEVEFADGTRLVNPSLKDIANQLGWLAKPRYEEYDLAIYGAGPAGLSAAVYAASEGLKTILVERSAIGGQAGTSSMIENYLGFPEGIAGAQLADLARQQALKFGAEILLLKEGISVCFKQDRIIVELTDGTVIRSKANICATGVEYARLELPGEDRFLYRGLYYGAGASEATLCYDRDIYIVGGGNMAGQAAIYFSGFARKVYLVVRKDNLSSTLSDYLVKRIGSIKNIEVIYNTEVTEMDGDSELRKITLKHNLTGVESSRDTGKLFVCIGGDPNTDWAIGTDLLRCKKGYLVTGNDLLKHDGFEQQWRPDRLPFHLETSVPGFFAVGDVRYGSVKRVASAVGDGAMAVTQVHQYLSHSAE